LVDDDRCKVPIVLVDDKDRFLNLLSGNVSGFPDPLVDETNGFTRILLGMVDIVEARTGSVKVGLPLDMGVCKVEKDSLSE